MWNLIFWHALFAQMLKYFQCLSVLSKVQYSKWLVVGLGYLFFIFLLLQLAFEKTSHPSIQIYYSHFQNQADIFSESKCMTF